MVSPLIFKLALAAPFQRLPEFGLFKEQLELYGNDNALFCDWLSGRTVCKKVRPNPRHFWAELLRLTLFSRLITLIWCATRKDDF